MITTVFSRLSSMVFSFILYVTFLFAYFFNNYHFAVSINDYGEATVELLLITCMFVLIIIENIIFFRKVLKTQ